MANNLPFVSSLLPSLSSPSPQLVSEKIQRDLIKQRTKRLTAASDIYTSDQTFAIPALMPSFER